MEKRVAVSDAVHKQAEIRTCVYNAQVLYNQEWFKACTNLFKQEKAGLQNCVHQAAAYANYMKGPYTSPGQTRRLFLLGESNCQVAFGLPKFDPQCSLPNPQGGQLNEQLVTSEADCKNIGS